MPATRKPSLPTLICMVFACCAMTAITSPAQTLTTLASFTGNNGFEPYSSLTQATDGNFYGTTDLGGDLSKCNSSGCGTIFKVTPSGALKVIYTFSGPDGETPRAVVQGGDGNLYGTTFCSDQNFHGATFSGDAFGFCNGPGSFFRLSPSGTLTTLYTFCSLANCVDGGSIGRVIRGSDGNFYGTTAAGGANNRGTVFKITPSGTLTTLYSFTGPDGDVPFGGLIQGSDGNFYGTTILGGGDLSKCNSAGCGTIFKVTPSGELTTLHSFTGPDGAQPLAELVQATDGSFYGTTSNGGANNNCVNGGCGTVFRITPSGTLTNLYNFAGMDGAEPHAGLVQAADGNFYGTTDQGGLADFGTAFRITRAGTLTVLHSFCSENGCADGNAPEGPLVQGANGLLYGTASLGGISTCNPPSGCGTVFSLSVNPIPNQFVPLAQPCRAVDTRLEHGGGGPIPGGTFQNFPISGAGACPTLPSAAVYSMNVTVVPQGSLGYLTVWPQDQPRPLASTLNSLDGRIKANAAIVPAGASGNISMYATDTTNVIVDVNSYFAPISGSTLAFYPLTPCRVADTRKSGFPQGLGPPFLTGSQERAFPMLNATNCNVPSNAAAYSLNFSVVPHGSLFYMTVWPTGETRPTVSTLNDIPGTIIANAAIVVAGTNGNVSVYPTNDTDLIIDINGYFAPAGTGGLSLYGVQPCRVIDTRKVGNGNPFGGTLSPPVDVANAGCGTSSSAQAYVFNASVVPHGALGYLTLWPDGANRPVVSTLNALDGSISSNMAIVPSTNGKVDAYASGITQLILDISSYFAP